MKPGVYHLKNAYHRCIPSEHAKGNIRPSQHDDRQVTNQAIANQVQGKLRGSVVSLARDLVKGEMLVSDGSQGSPGRSDRQDPNIGSTRLHLGVRLTPILRESTS